LISLQTYSKLQSGANTKLYIYHHVREDIELFFGFHDKEERVIFCHLIAVSGIGPNTARTMLSSMTSEEIRNAIITGDINKLKSIKGIGLKTAQRLLIELKDKIIKGGVADISGSFYEGGIPTQIFTKEAFRLKGMRRFLLLFCSGFPNKMSKKYWTLF